MSTAENDAHMCGVPACDQPAVALLANDASYLSPEYAERWVCRWHQGAIEAATRPIQGDAS